LVIFATIREKEEDGVENVNQIKNSIRTQKQAHNSITNTFPKSKH